MLCSISAEIPKEPVVSLKSGHIFENRLIQKHIKIHGKCPITGVDLSEQDLLPLKTSTISKPRPPTANSIPALLSFFQNEWDALMLETFELKQSHQQSRMELSTALYENDAAKRVIARLMIERDQAREKLNQIQQNMHSNVDMQVDEENVTDTIDHTLSQSVITLLEKTGHSLSEHRRKRKVGGTVCTPDEISTFKSSQEFHSSKSGVDCLSIKNDDRWSLLVTGNKKGNVSVFDYEKGTVSFDEKGHSGTVRCIKWINTISFVSVGEDGFVNMWRLVNSEWTETAIKLDSKGLVWVSVHPSHKLVLVASEDGHWFLIDVDTNQLLYKTPTACDCEYTSIEFHPDGMLFATGCSDGKIQIWDLVSQTIAQTFHDHPVSIKGLSFSENGYFLATIGEENFVRIWDLRKLSNVHSIEIPCPATCVSWDHSAQYLGVGVNSEVKVFLNKKWTNLLTVSSEKGLSGLVFGSDARSIVVSSSNGKIHVLNRQD